MSFRVKITGLLLILLMLTCDFQSVILVLASTRGLNNSCATAGDTSDFEFLKRQLENATPSECPLLERSYVIPSGMDLSLADEIWLKIAPLISLGYNEKEILKAIDEAGLPRMIEANGAPILVDYANLSVTRSLENGEVSVEIPVLCNSSLSSVYYEVKGVKKHIWLYNITLVRYYNVSVRTSDFCNVTCSREDNQFSKAILDLSGNLKNNVINVYFPNLEKPVFSEICFNLSSYGVSLSLRVLECKVYDIDSGGKRTDCFWIRVNATLRTNRDVPRVMFRIGHGDGWVNKHWLILRRGEYASDYWVKWTPNDKLIVDFNAEGFGNRFILNFGEIVEKWNDSFNKVLSEDELKNLLEQPPCFELNLSKAPRFLHVDFAGEKVINETIQVTNEEYEWLARLGWKKDNSIFIDSGEIEWEYAVTNRTLDRCKSIRLFYNPLKVSRGELVHGLSLRNYANTNLNYTLRLRTTTGFFFFPKVDEGDATIVLNKSSINHLLLVQREPAVGDAFLELVNDDRVVAAVKVYLLLKTTMYWKGFWEGLASKLPGIMVIAGVMMVTGFLIPLRYIRPTYYILLGLNVLMNLAEVALDIAEANTAKDEMLVLAKAFENRAREFLVRGEVEHTSECLSFALALRKEVNETMNNLLLNVLSDLAVGVSFDEIRIALGLKEPPARDELERQYKIGYARGRVTGAVVSCVLYVTLFMMVNRIKVERTGQRLTVNKVFRLIVRGVYNWITPTILDTVILILGKVKGFADRVVDLLLANKYSRRFGDVVGNLLQDVKGDLSKIKDILDASSQFSKNVLENVPSWESSKKILDALGMIIEQYSLEDLGKKGRIVTRSIVSIWIKDGDDAIDSLNNWLSKNMGDLNRMAVLEEVLMAISGDAVKGVGLKIENIVNSYFDVKNRYSRDVMEAFLSKVVRHPDALEEILVKLNSFDFMEKPHKVILRKGMESTLDIGESNKVDPGTYVVRVYWEYGEKNGIIDFSVKKNVESHRINMPREQVNQILDQVVSDEAKILVTKVELFDYRLFFPAEFIVNDKKITLDLFNNEMEINGVTYKFIAYQDVHAGKIRVDTEFEGKNIEGRNLVLSFYQDSKLGIKHDDGSRLIKEIEIDPKRSLMRIEYLKGDEKHAEYSFNSKPLEAQMGRIPCAIIVRDQERTGLEGPLRLRLKEELFRLLGYDALIELEKRIRDIDEERIVLLVHFDNSKTVYCRNKDLRVNVPSGAGKITGIEIIVFKELSDIKKYAAGVLEKSQDPRPKGELGEAIVREKFMDIILAEIAERSGISKDELVVNPLGGSGRADFEIKVSGTSERIAVVEVKYVGDPENVEEFGKQLNEARIQIKDRFNDPKQTAPYGVVVVIAWSPEQIINDEPYPPTVGSYKNPYIEYHSREGG